MTILKKVRFTSLEDASILRKFTILFILMSLLPVSVLYYFYIQIRDFGEVRITEVNFSITLAFVVLGISIGYLAMRSVLKKMIDITRANQQTLEAVLGPEKLKELSDGENEIAVLAKSFSEITNRLEENIKNLELAKRTLHSVLAKVGQGISSMQNIDAFLELIVETVVDAFSAKTGILLMADQVKHEMYIQTSYGIKGDTIKNKRISKNSEPVKMVIKAKKPVIIRDTEHDKIPEDFKHVFELPMFCAPLILHDSIIGVIAVCGKEKGAEGFQEDEKSLIQNLALQTAVAIENSRLNEDVEKTYFETISALALAVDAKDKYSRGHLDRVAKYVVNIAEQLGLSEIEKKTLRDAARLHDVGKIGVPDEILLKPSSLTDAEMEMMKRHCEIGESIIKPIRSLRNLCDIIRHHHEKLDGSGYPDGLRGDEISLLARITTVADIFDALTTDRPYRKKFSIDEAFKNLRDMQGKVDQTIVDALYESVNGKNGK